MFDISEKNCESGSEPLGSTVHKVIIYEGVPLNEMRLKTKAILGCVRHATS